MDQLPALKLFLWSLYDEAVRLGSARCATFANGSDDIPEIAPDSSYCWIVVIDFWQLLKRDMVRLKEFHHLFFAHNLMVRNHLVFQYVK